MFTGMVKHAVLKVMQRLASFRENIQFSQGQAFRLIRWTEYLSKTEEVISPKKIIAHVGHGDQWHYHRQTQLTLVQQGKGSRYIADNIEFFQDGDLTLTGFNVPHHWQARGKSSGISIQWYFPEQHGIWDLHELSLLRSLEEAARKGLHVTGQTATNVRILMERMQTLTCLHRLSHLLQIISYLVNAPNHEMRALSSRSFSLSGTDEHQQAIRRAVSYINTYFREPIRLEVLLEITAMSRATFARQFQMHAGRSFSVFLNQIRLQAVCRALRDTGKPITSIALENGFNQLSLFNRLFLREFKINPTAYRERNQPAQSKESKMNCLSHH